MQIELPDISRYSTALNEVSTTRNSGKVVQVLGLTIEAIGLDCQIGEVCLITTSLGVTIMSEVIGFKEERVLLMPLGDMQGIQPGSKVFPISKSFRAPVGTVLLGRVLDGLGRPMDGGPELDTVKKVST
ncbi:MAG: EscN/YscN/HrcN family type III secretion system ATPase, partial [Anaerolineaceae bacterium]